MTVASSILSALIVVAAAASSAAPKSAPIDIFPEPLVFEATVMRASSSPWKGDSSQGRTRTIEVELRIDRVLKAAPPARPPAEGRTLTTTVTETSRTFGRLEPSNVWGDADLKPGDAFLVFADAEDAASAFAQPTSVFRRQSDPALVQDVEWIVEGEKLDVATQASRLLALLGKSPTDHTLFVGRYLAAVAHRAAGPSRAALLDAAAHVDSIKLDENARAELLRSFHVGLVMQDAPPADEMQALLAACLRTLAAAPAAGEIPARLESVVQVYLPWLAKHVPSFSSAASRVVSKDERERAQKTARSLSAMERFPARSREVLRQLAGS